MMLKDAQSVFCSADQTLFVNLEGTFNIRQGFAHAVKDAQTPEAIVNPQLGGRA
jgi:hypothetical protein